MKAIILKTADECEAALARVESLMDAKPGSAKEEELKLWSLLVERYEEENFPIDLPDPVEAIKFRMEQERDETGGSRQGPAGQESRLR